jgi:hypothetical protein
MIDARRLRERRHGGGNDEANDAPIPGKQSVAGQMAGGATTASDRAWRLIEQLDQRASRLESAIASRDFEAADDAASLVDRFRHGLAYHLDQIDDPELHARAASVVARLDAVMPLAPEPRAGNELVTGGAARRRAAWLARCGSSSGGALPAAVRGKLERAGAGDLSGVRVHTDRPAADAAGAIDARAFTVGQDIYFGAGQLDPDSAEGQHVLAHEVAHTVQQRGGDATGAPLAMSAAGDAGEREAESFAAAVASGATASIAERGPASIQRFGIGDVIGVVAGPVAPALAKQTGLDDALASGSAEVLADLVDGGAALLELIGRVHAGVARLVIRRLAELQLDVVLEALELATKTAVIQLLLDALGSAEIRRLVLMLAETNTAAMRRVLKAIHQTDLMEVVGRALFELPGHLLRGILHTAGGSVLARLWELLPDDVLGYILWALDEYWPVGVGVAIGAHIGATFGIPLHIRGEYEANVRRPERDPRSLALWRRGEARAAADTGVSAGVWFGAGNMGVGAQVGANAEAGGKAIVTQEFEFPVFDEPNTFLPLIFSFFLMESSMLANVGNLILGVPRPERYNTRTQFELKGYVSGAAEGELGARQRDEKTQPGQVQKGDSAPEIGKNPWWAKLAGLSVGVFAHANIEGGLGIEMKPDWKDVTDRSQGPNHVDVAFFVGGSAGLDVIARLPLGLPVPALPSLGGGIGAKLKYRATRSEDGNDPVIRYEGMELSAGKGELERYNGSATEVTVEGNEPPREIGAFLSSLDGKKLTIRKRFGVGTGTGRSLMRRSQAGLRSLLPNSTGSAFTLEGYVTVTCELTGEQAKQIVRRILDAAESVKEKGLAGVLSDVTTFLSSGDVTGELAGHIDAIAAMLAEHVTEVALHGRSGLTIFGGAKVAGGLKARLDFSAGGFFTVDKDLLAILQRVTPSELAALLRDKVTDAADDMLNFTADGIDPLPVR